MLVKTSNSLVSYSTARPAEMEAAESNPLKERNPQLLSTGIVFPATDAGRPGQASCKLMRLRCSKRVSAIGRKSPRGVRTKAARQFG